LSGIVAASKEKVAVSAGRLAAGRGPGNFIQLAKQSTMIAKNIVFFMLKVKADGTKR